MKRVRAQVVAQIESVEAELVALSRRVHRLAETGWAEHESVGSVARLLEAHGFAVSVGDYGLPTALRACAGTGRPRVALLAEYDALPGIGHGCGHNVICASAVGVFLGVARVIGRVGGSVALLGTPAEENGSGKELMARSGAFDEVDAVLMLHPTSGQSIADVTGLGLRSVEVTYHGVAAHACGAPSEGRNALDAMVAAYQGVAALRQHIADTERIHGIITDGGQAANVVPARAAGRFLLRSADERGLAALSRRVHRVLSGAALSTETRLEARWDQTPPCLPIRGSAPLAQRFAEHYGGRGHHVLPSGTMLGSTDLGNLSVRLPAIHPAVAIAPAGVALHTEEFARFACSTSADTAMLDGAVALALTALDYLSDAGLRAKVSVEFTERGGPVDVAALMSSPAEA